MGCVAPLGAGPEVAVLAEVLAARLALVGGLLADIEAQLADAHLVRTRKDLWEKQRRKY